MTATRQSKRRQAVLESITVDEFKELVDRFGLMGNAEAAKALGIAQPNLLRLRDLPEPAAQVKASRLWVGQEVNDYAARRRRRAA
jgi:hypothetical protein